MISRSKALAALFRSALAGALFGAALFALESALILRSGAIGLKMDVEGPFQALFAAVRPLLPALLARVGAAYLLGGALLGLAAGLLVAMLGVEGRWKARLLFLFDLAALALLLAIDRAIARPALFDDLPQVRGLLAVLVERGEPWHPRALGGALFGLHLAAALLKTRPERTGLRLPMERPGLWRRFSPVAAGAAGLCLISLFVHAAPMPARAPLIVLVGIDAFRPDRLKANGGSGQVAPHLERFLTEATRFDAAYTPIAQTEPAYRSLLTARWPSATGVRYPLTPDEKVVPLPTFPEALRQAGWRTSFQTDCARFHWQGEGSGFEVRRQPPRGAINFALEKLRYRALGVLADNAAGAALLPEFVDNRALAGIHDPKGYARRLAAALEKDAASGPALFVFHATAAHFPGDPIHPHYRRFVSPSAPLERRLRMVFSPIGAGTQAASGWGRVEAEALYDELLGQADAQLGVLLESLKQSGRYEEATVIVFSDHGESFHADHPEIAGATPVHGARLSEEENRILLAVKLPRSLSGEGRPEKVGSLVRLLDLGPTVLDLAGAAPLPGADGASLLPLLKGQAEPPRRLFAETGFTHASPDVFDPGHLAGAPRTFEAYHVRPDGVVEQAAAAHDLVMQEKDFGAFDGRSWIIRSPRKDGTVSQACLGPCDDPGLSAWLEEKLK